ncbi:macro domain-containing protein [Chitinophaga arvensicola]|uniref:O-acetyl-ADP-ribose deacetylase (Regulator of RNase III), contains Macro domain n=1 Tax=Chitinophaga arvensicola TaxID=29529 RepID=A0A1I0QVD7_9BACT|nr:macro domain-containing protein [Chitinophaga arvensicola]SEW30969.1 O-acetyl-ADP-ribose deacetylase (regulator of RNase III), contains Macro domain [Chitinophaga arvensicola]
MIINYITGDALKPVGEGNKIIVHVCNDIGAWGKGFVLPLAKKWPRTKAVYLDAFKSATPPQLGDIQLINVEQNMWVVNMIGQHKITTRQTKGGIPPVRYEAILAALRQVAVIATELSAAVHMPRIGCGLAGGTWDKIEPLIQDAFSPVEVGVYVYDLAE